MVAPSLERPRACGIAEPIHPDIRNRKEAENPVVEDDVGVVDLEERGGGELGVFVKPAVAHAATRAYAEGLGFSAVGVVQDVLAPVHLLEARGLSIQQTGELAEGDGLCFQAAGSDDPEGGVLRRLLGEIPVAVSEVDGGIGRGGFVEVLEKRVGSLCLRLRGAWGYPRSRHQSAKARAAWRRRRRVGYPPWGRRGGFHGVR